MKYHIVEHEGDCDLSVEADDIDSAIKLAEAWLADGDWGEEESIVDVTITDEDGEETKVECVVGGVPPPACLDGKDHEWEWPYEVVGGLRENPGVWSLNCGQLAFVEVCCHCGCYRDKTTKSLSGEWPRMPERVTYREPDEKSLTWAGLLNDCEDA